MKLIAQWNDEANNRIVHFSIGYSVNDSVLSIDTVTPTKVCILDETNETVLKSKGVHTSSGRQLLTEQLKASGQMEEFAAEISRRCGLQMETIS